MDDEKKLTQLKPQEQAPGYPKARLICGDIQRITNPSAVLERFHDGGWIRAYPQSGAN